MEHSTDLPVEEIKEDTPLIEVKEVTLTPVAEESKD